jgi:hypothetical protein
VNFFRIGLQNQSTYYLTAHDILARAKYIKQMLN